MKIETSIYDAPCGKLLIGSYGSKLCLCDWIGGLHSHAIHRRLCRLLETTFEESTSDTNRLASFQLDEYFAGLRKQFNLPSMLCGTPFQKNIWTSLAGIGYATTVSYAGLARMACCHTSVRAVANAVASNPLSVIIPCHRITGSSNLLGGYGGGVAAKRFLLSLENNNCNV